MSFTWISNVKDSGAESNTLNQIYSNLNTLLDTINCTSDRVTNNISEKTSFKECNSLSSCSITNSTHCSAVNSSQYKVNNSGNCPQDRTSHNGTSHKSTHNGTGHNGTGHNGTSHKSTHNGTGHNGTGHNGIGHNGSLCSGNWTTHNGTQKNEHNPDDNGGTYDSVAEDVGC